jgi:2-dehydropantoate 2-reductase
MKILIFGAGAVGSFIGGRLSKSNEVVFLCRKQHADTINKKGLKITNSGTVIYHPKAFTDLSGVDFKPELIILTVKAYDTQKAGIVIKGKYPYNIPVLSIQNGIGNAETLIKILGKNNVMVGLTSHGITFKAYGYVHHAGSGDTVFGELNCKKSNRLRRISLLFKEAGIDNRLVDNIQGEIWAKAIVNSCINPLTTITGLENGYLLKIPSLETALEMVCIEGIEVARSLGIVLPKHDIVEKAKNVVRFTAKNKSSMLQDLEKGKMTEIDAINGAIVRAGRKIGIKTPANELMIALVNAKSTDQNLTHYHDAK